MSTLWRKSGKLVVSAARKLVRAALCPCNYQYDPCEWTIDEYSYQYDSCEWDITP